MTKYYDGIVDLFNKIDFKDKKIVPYVIFFDNDLKEYRKDLKKLTPKNKERVQQAVKNHALVKGYLAYLVCLDVTMKTTNRKLGTMETCDAISATLYFPTNRITKIIPYTDKGFDEEFVMEGRSNVCDNWDVWNSNEFSASSKTIMQ